jgi:hypothetical protein
MKKIDEETVEQAEEKKLKKIPTVIYMRDENIKQGNTELDTGASVLKLI